MKLNMPPLRIGKFTARLPIIQGGMSVGVSLSQLASAVANEGGIGVIGAAGIGMLEPDYTTHFKEANIRVLKQEIRKARVLSQGILGVNIMSALSDAEGLIEAAVEENVDIIFIGAGLPLDTPKILQKESLREFSPLIIPIVSSARAARIILTYWDRHYNRIPDGFVVEGPLAGGHLGFKRENLTDDKFLLERIVSEVISEIPLFADKYEKEIPVIAAGGIYSGSDIFRFLQLGAQGVQMATRFVATEECDANIHFKESYVQSKQEDIVIIDSPVGLPGRVINNSFLTQMSTGTHKPFHCTWKCLKTCNYKKVAYCINTALTNAKLGNMQGGFAFAGANAYRIQSIITVKELIQMLTREYCLAALRTFPI